MGKKKKSSAEKLISNVLEDLQKSTEEPSISFRATASGMSSSSANSSNHDDKTAVIGSKPQSQAPLIADDSEYIGPAEATVVAGGKRSTQEPEAKVSFGHQPRISGDPALVQAENLRLAQERIIELEKAFEKIRRENELLSSAGELAQAKIEELQAKLTSADRVKSELSQQNESELRIFKDGLNIKENDINRLKLKVEELEGRLAQDLRKVRVRERELENRLELTKMEKNALVRAKDETILDLKRKIEHFETEIDSYKTKIIELNEQLEANQEQFSRTVRALRLALTNLEVSEGTGNSITLAPLKKVE